jgi:hypothetical protein
MLTPATHDFPQKKGLPYMKGSSTLMPQMSSSLKENFR